ncbi:hypothetical protein G4D64_02255 [Bacillus sp. 3H-10]|uniref:Uncharacterized protein n=1 Tax=Bacillus aquiflavi TaxID=2672567 RepID=A0A6B3VYE0_9BACI|nr:hypothetical protein [Bacillus aquiflavi]NEY80364.1 hypothetical protein [Bacillus aquiflavi]
MLQILDKELEEYMVYYVIYENYGEIMYVLGIVFSAIGLVSLLVLLLIFSYRLLKGKKSLIKWFILLGTLFFMTLVLLQMFKVL